MCTVTVLSCYDVTVYFASVLIISTLSSSPPQDGKARVVDGISSGRGLSSFGINPHNYKRTGTEQREPSTKSATGIGSPQSSLATASHSTSHLSQASIRATADEDTLIGEEGEERACCDKLLLTTNSIGMSETGRPVYKMSMSEGGAVGVQHQVSMICLVSITCIIHAVLCTCCTSAYMYMYMVYVPACAHF